MALDRLLPVSTTPGAISGDSYMDAVQEEVTGLWDRSRIKLSGVSGANTITATITPALTAGLVDGMSFVLVPVATNTAAVTLNGTNVLDAEGNALPAGALRIGGTYDLLYRSAISAFVVVGYIPAATLLPAAKLLKTQLASGVGSIDFVNGVSGVVFDDTYDSYFIDFTTIKPSTDDQALWMRFGTGGGPAYQTTNYQWAFNAVGNAGTSTGTGSSSSSRINLGQPSSGGGAGVGNALGENASGRVTIPNPEQTDYHTITFACSYISASIGLIHSAGSGCWAQGTPITALRFMFESGNIAAGRFSLYGFAKV